MGSELPAHRDVDIKKLARLAGIRKPNSAKRIGDGWYAPANQFRELSRSLDFERRLEEYWSFMEAWHPLEYPNPAAHRDWEFTKAAAQFEALPEARRRWAQRTGIRRTLDTARQLYNLLDFRSEGKSIAGAVGPTILFPTVGFPPIPPKGDVPGLSPFAFGTALAELIHRCEVILTAENEDGTPYFPQSAPKGKAKQGADAARVAVYRLACLFLEALATSVREKPTLLYPDLPENTPWEEFPETARQEVRQAWKKAVAHSQRRGWAGEGRNRRPASQLLKFLKEAMGDLAPTPPIIERYVREAYKDGQLDQALKAPPFDR